MPDAISVSVTDETPVPQAPDPPCTSPSRWAGAEVRFSRSEEAAYPASPAARPRAERGRPAHERVPDRPAGGAAAPPARAWRAHESGGAGARAEQGRVCGAVGAGCFLCGLLLAAACAGLAVLPLCSWTAKGQREKRRRWCYAGGACVGIAVFCAWAAALVVVMLARAGSEEG